MTERLHFHFSLSCLGEGNGNPLQCSCLENPRDGGAWWAAIYRVSRSRTRLKQLGSSSNASLKLMRELAPPLDLLQLPALSLSPLSVKLFLWNDAIEWDRPNCFPWGILTSNQRPGGSGSAYLLPYILISDTKYQLHQVPVPVLSYHPFPILLPTLYWHWTLYYRENLPTSNMPSWWQFNILLILCSNLIDHSSIIGYLVLPFFFSFFFLL